MQTMKLLTCSELGKKIKVQTYWLRHTRINCCTENVNILVDKMTEDVQINIKYKPKKDIVNRSFHI